MQPDRHRRGTLAPTLLAGLLLAPALAQAVVVHPGVDSQVRLREALALVQPGEAVELAAGVFRLEEYLTVAVESSILRGAGKNRTILVFHPGATANSGLRVQANGVELSGFSVQDALGSAVRVTDVTDVLIRDLGVRWTVEMPAQAAFRNGLEILGCQDLLLQNIEVRNASAAGILIGNSVRVMVRGATLEENGVGLRLESSNLVDLRDSSIQWNGTGAHLRSPATPEALRRVRIFDNRILNNNNFSLPAADGTYRGAGLVVAGGQDVEISGNEIGGHGTFNVLVEAADSTSFPDRIRIRDNQLGRSGYAPDLERARQMIDAGQGRLASIVWDGEVPWREMIGLKPRTERILLGRNGEADFVDLDLAWFRTLKALHAPKRNYEDYAGSLRPLPDFTFVSSRIRALARD